MARLLDAGLECFAEQGWHDAAIDDIVRRADSSHGTFYLYFGNKQDLLVTLAHECAAVMVDLVGDLVPADAGADGRAAVRAWLDRFLVAYERYRGVVRAWMESQVDHPDLADLGASVMGTYGQRFADLVRPGAASDEEAALRAAALLALLERFSYMLSSRDLTLDRERVLDTLATVVHRGFLVTEPATRS